MKRQITAFLTAALLLAAASCAGEVQEGAPDTAPQNDTGTA